MQDNYDDFTVLVFTEVFIVQTDDKTVIFGNAILFFTLLQIFLSLSPSLLLSILETCLNANTTSYFNKIIYFCI